MSFVSDLESLIVDARSNLQELESLVRKAQSSDPAEGSGSDRPRKSDEQIKQLRFAIHRVRQESVKTTQRRGIHETMAWPTAVDAAQTRPISLLDHF